MCVRVDQGKRKRIIVDEDLSLEEEEVCCCCSSVFCLVSSLIRWRTVVPFGAQTAYALRKKRCLVPGTRCFFVCFGWFCQLIFAILIIRLGGCRWRLGGPLVVIAAFVLSVVSFSPVQAHQCLLRAYTFPFLTCTPARPVGCASNICLCFLCSQDYGDESPAHRAAAEAESPSAALQSQQKPGLPVLHDDPATGGADATPPTAPSASASPAASTLNHPAITAQPVFLTCTRGWRKDEVIDNDSSDQVCTSTTGTMTDLARNVSVQSFDMFCRIFVRVGVVVRRRLRTRPYIGTWPRTCRAATRSAWSGPARMRPR